MKLALLVLIIVIGAIYVEGRSQQILVRQQAKVYGPPPIPPIIYGRPLRFQAPVAPRRPRHTNIGPQNNPLLKKSTKNSPKPKKYVPTPPKPKPAISKSVKYVAPEPIKTPSPKPIVPKATVEKVPVQQVRNERQISSSDYNIPKGNSAPKVVEPKTSKYVAPKQEKKEEPRII